MTCTDCGGQDGHHRDDCLIHPHATGSRVAIVVESLETAYRAGWEDFNRWGHWGHNGRTRRERFEAEAQKLLAKLEATGQTDDATRSRAAAVAVLDEVQNAAYPTWATGEYLMKKLEDAGFVVTHATPDRVADRPDRGEKAVTLSLYPNENGLWVWIAYIGDGEVEGSAKGAAGGFEYASDALADAMGRFPQIVVRHAEALQ